MSGTPPSNPLVVFVCDTVTGRVLRRDIPFVGVPSWSYGLNDVGRFQPRVPLGDPQTGAMDPSTIDHLLDYWRLSWGIRWGGHILQCGPVVTDRFGDTEGPAAVDVGCVGIWGLFNTKRLLLRGSWTGTNPAEANADTIFSSTSPDTANRDLSLHSIARRLIEDNMSRPGHGLPIDLPFALPGNSERTYPGYDLAYVGARLYELTQVIGGPEIEFRPYFTDTSMTYVRWEMRIGYPDGNPDVNGRLGNLYLPHTWTYQQALTHVDVDGDGTGMTGESYVRGNGMERSMPIGHAKDATLVNAGWPALVVANSDHSSAIEQVTLDGWASADVSSGGRPSRVFEGVVRMDGSDGQGNVTATQPIDQLRAGDTGRMRIAGHRRLPDGTYPGRVIAVSNGQDISTATLSFERQAGAL